MNEAYSTLSDQQKREKYDQTRLRIENVVVEEDASRPSSAEASSAKKTTKRSMASQAVRRRMNTHFRTAEEFVKTALDVYATFGVICIAAVLARA